MFLLINIGVLGGKIMTDNEKVQKLTIALLQKYISICEENNLRYYFTGGALIGVLRHKGFIPWDDDIDVGMPRKDYDKFLQILDKDMPEGYGICNRFTDKDWHFAMSQFIDKESEIEINLAETPRKAHIWVDVFPLDGLPLNRVHRWFRIKHILFFRYLVQIAHIKTQVDSHRERPWYEKIMLGLMKIIPFGMLINTDNVLDKLDKLLRKNDFDTAQYVGNMLGRYRKREVVPAKYFGKAKKGLFEGIMVNIPEMSHELQTALYGDYMKLPPEKDRDAHNVRTIKSRDI